MKPHLGSLYNLEKQVYSFFCDRWTDLEWKQRLDDEAA